MLRVKELLSQMITEDYKCWFGLYDQSQRDSILHALGPGPLQKPAAVRHQIISWLSPWAHFFTLIQDSRNIVKAEVLAQSGQSASYGYYTPLSNEEDQDINKSATDPSLAATSTQSSGAAAVVKTSHSRHLSGFLGQGDGRASRP